MRAIGEKIVLVIAALIALFIIFVRAGESGTSGGAQTQTILNSFGSNVSKVIATLQGQSSAASG